MAENPDPLLARVLRLAGPAALAGAVVLGYVTRRGDGAGSDDAEALPHYGVVARAYVTDGGVPEPAPSPSARLRLEGGARAFEILLRPSSATTGRIAAWPFTFADGGEPTPMQADVDVSPQGVVRIRGVGASLAGVREVRVVLAPAGAAKFDVAAERARTRESDAHVRVIDVSVDR